MSTQPRELSCRHTWTLWIKGVMLPSFDTDLGRPAAAFRSNCTRCGLFRVVTVPDGGVEPGTRHAICPQCFLPTDDPPDALRWPAAIRDCACGQRADVRIDHGESACRAHRSCAACGATAAFPLGG